MFLHGCETDVWLREWVVWKKTCTMCMCNPNLWNYLDCGGRRRRVVICDELEVAKAQKRVLVAPMTLAVWPSTACLAADHPLVYAFDLLPTFRGVRAVDTSSWRLEWQQRWTVARWRWRRRDDDNFSFNGITKNTNFPYHSLRLTNTHCTVNSNTSTCRMNRTSIICDVDVLGI